MHACPSHRPPTSDVCGIATAMAIILSFLAVWYHALFHIRLAGPRSSHWLDVAATFVGLEFLYTGVWWGSAVWLGVGE